MEPTMADPTFDAGAALEHLRGSDAVLRKVIDRIGDFDIELQTSPSTFASLAQAIIFQQLSPKAAGTIFGRLCALFPDCGGHLDPEHITGAEDDLLRSAGVSGSKLLSLRDLARRTLDGTVPDLHEAILLGDDELTERLVEVRGIGKWSAQMFLIFKLGRPDVLPVDDYGMRRGFGVAFKKGEMPSKEDVSKRAKRWTPYRSVASWYLWRVAEEK
jgi:3-methyladenine DNA glycosylase/8-oxoguanine DNA glycosylase